MPEWTICSHCSLKHRGRPDGHCPRCKQPVAGGAAPPEAGASMPAVYDGRALPGSRLERATAKGGDSKGKMIGSIVLMIAAMLAGKVIYQKFLAPAARGGAPPGVEEGSQGHLQYVADQINATLPKDVDSDTRLTRVFVREREFIYEMELVKYSSRSLDSNAFMARATPLLRGQACSNPKIKGFWKYGIKATFQIVGNDRGTIGTVSVSSSDCGA